MYVGSDPMEEARRIKQLMGLDNIQYRRTGVILCRGISRLKRPVVLSAELKIGDGPRREHGKAMKTPCPFVALETLLE